MENIDVMVNMVEPLIPEYERSFKKLQDMNVELPNTIKTVFVFLRVHRKIDKTHPVYIIADVIAMNDVGKVIKQSPKLPSGLPKKLREDIDHYEVIVRNGQYVNSKMIGGIIHGSYPVFSLLDEEQINSLIQLSLANGLCSENIVNEYFGKKTFKA